MTQCLFCEIAAGKIPSKKVDETNFLFAFHDIHPQAPVHILIIPKKHISKLSELTAGDVQLMGEITAFANQIASIQKLTDYRLVVNNGAEAGQTVFHLHVHLLAGRKMNWPPG